MKKMTPEDTQVLQALHDLTEPETAVGFAPIMRETEMPRAEVRRRCRYLARIGLAEFCCALWTEDGKPRGSGYGLTRQGRAVAEAQAVPK